MSARIRDSLLTVVESIALTLPESKIWIAPPAVVVLCMFGLGVFVDHAIDLDWRLSLVTSLTALLLWIGCFRTKRCQVLAACLLTVAIAFAGSFWHHGCWNWFPTRDLMSFCQTESQPVCLRARILGEAKHSAVPEDEPLDPLPKKVRTTFIIEPLEIRNGTEWEQASGRSQLIVHGQLHAVSFGDDVLVLGSLVPLSKPMSPGQFNFQNYYRARRLTASVHVFNAGSVVVEQPRSPWSNAAVLSELRKKLNELIWKHVSSESAGFASAILLGNREQLTFSERQAFVTTGTAHLLAISGLHLGILASIFLLLYRFGLLNRRWALIATIVFVVFYVWLVEFRPPVTRAAILLVLFCSGRLIGRSGMDFNLLAIAGVFVLILNPRDLFALGPQLSFLAVASLILFKDSIFPPLSNDPIDRLIRSTRPWYVRILNRVGQRCKQAVFVSGLIWLLGLPLVALNYHLVTPVAFVVNPIVLVPIALALFGGLGVSLFGFWLPSAADLFGKLSSVSLQLVTGLIEFAESLEGGHWWSAGPYFTSVVAFYFLLPSLVFVSQQYRVKMMLLIWLAWLSLGWLLPIQAVRIFERWNNDVAFCTFIDVGHGSSTLIQFSDGSTMLYDAGSMASSRFAAATVSNLLWFEKIDHLDAIVISHADLDHFNAVPELSQRFSIGAVYVSIPMSDKRDVSLEGLFAELNSNSVEVRELAWNDFSELSNLEKINVLLPPDFGTGGNDNSESIVLLVEVAGHKIILPGDLEGNGMQLLLGFEPVDCDLALLPHHGSRHSRPDEFVQWCRPETIVVSAGQRKTDREVLAAIARTDRLVLPTGDLGTIRIKLTPHGLQTMNWSSGRWRRLQR